MRLAYFPVSSETYILFTILISLSLLTNSPFSIYVLTTWDAFWMRTMYAGLNAPGFSVSAGNVIFH